MGIERTLSRCSNGWEPYTRPWRIGGRAHKMLVAWLSAAVALVTERFFMAQARWIHRQRPLAHSCKHTTTATITITCGYTL